MTLARSVPDTPGLFRLSVPVPAIDVVLFTVIHGELCVAFVVRDKPPRKGGLALPGGIVARGHCLEVNCNDILERKAGLPGAAGVYKEQLGAFGDPGRDSRGHVLSVVFWALVPESLLAPAIDKRRVHPVRYADLDATRVCFDHAELVRAAKARLDERLVTSTIARHLLPRRFTLARLQAVYEAILGRRLDKRNFRKRIGSLGLVRATAAFDGSASRRPARLYEMAATPPRRF
jgi:8-oxo-dGTP diphosphatase